MLPGAADAACKKFGFTVNDYGKEGPTNDAKNLLDKHITEWASQNGVTDYQTGKKSVNCELFLDVILFDEHTCTASATVCWGPDAKKLGAQAAAVSEDDRSAGAPPPPVRKAEALGQAAPQQAEAAPAATAADADASATASADAAPTTPVEQIAAPAATPSATPAVHSAPTNVESMTPAAAAAATTGGVVETGALQAGQALSQPAAQKPAVPTISQQDRAAAAAAAASAAAAAERAAVAAETAASAAKEAAAAAVAASAASKAPAVVPPLDHASGAAPAHNE